MEEVLMAEVHMDQEQVVLSYRAQLEIAAALLQGRTAPLVASVVVVAALAQEP